jgi:hypothetical protein
LDFSFIPLFELAGRTAKGFTICAKGRALLALSPSSRRFIPTAARISPYSHLALLKSGAPVFALC